MDGKRLTDHLADVATAARQDSTLGSREHQLQARLKDLADERALGRRMALEAVIDEQTVEAAAKWAEADRQRQVEIRRVEIELAGVQSQRRLVRDALVTSARRWVFSNDGQHERSH